PPADLAGQPVCQFSDDLFPISGPLNLDQVHAARDGGARPGDQLSDAIEKRNFGLHNSPRIVSSTAALSASSAAISSMMSCGLRCTTASPPLGFFTERSKVAWSMDFASTLQDFGESANVACNSTNSARSASFSGLVLPRLRPGVELVIPDVARLRALPEEQHYGLHARSLKSAAGAIEHGVQTATLQQQLAQAHRSIVGVREEGVLDDHAAAPAGLENLDEVLQEEERRLAGPYGEVLLHFLALLAAEGRIGQHHVVAVLFLYVGEVLGERIGVDDVGRIDAMQDHVHDGDDVGQRLLLLAVKSAGLERAEFPGSERGLGLHEIERLAQEARRTHGAIVDAFADLGPHHAHHGADERARSVILAAVAAGVAHVADLGLVEMRQLVLLGLRAEVELVDVVDDFAQVVAARDLVFDFAEDLADFVFDGVRSRGLLLESVQVGEELLVDEGEEVVAGHGAVVVGVAVLAPGGGPRVPAIGLVEDEGVLLAVQGGFVGLILLQPVQVFQEEEPGGLLGVVQLGGAAGLFPEHVVDVLEGLFKHG